jgi:drug/metabolite transporter (DMT)-like permease
LQPDVSGIEKGRGSLLFYLLIGLVTLSWGLGIPTMKIGLTVMHPFTFLLFRSILSSLAILSLILLRRGALRPPQGRPEFWWNVLLHNLTFVVLCHAMVLTTAARTSVFLYTQPIFYVVLAAWFVPSERFGGRSIMGFAAAFGGIVVLFGEKFWVGGTDTLLGDAAVMLSALIWGIQSFYLRHRLKGIDPFRIAVWTQLISIPLFLFFVLIRGLALPDFLNQSVLISVGYNGLIATGLVMIVWVRLLAEYPPSRVSAFMFLTPVFGVTLSILILSEPLTVFMLTGAALVAVGIYLVNTERHPLADKIVVP